jgi:hypothetical protein
VLGQRPHKARGIAGPKPVAVQLAGAAHDTAVRAPSGMVCTTQLLPFHCSAHPQAATAMQSDRTGQDTPTSSALFGSGIAWTRQVPLLALAGATPETTAQITTAALTTIPFTGAFQPSAVRLT